MTKQNLPDKWFLGAIWLEDMPGHPEHGRLLSGKICARRYGEIFYVCTCVQCTCSSVHVAGHNGHTPAYIRSILHLDRKLSRVW